MIKVCLYTPNHEEYKEERGVYIDVLNSLAKVWYTDEELLLNHLIHDRIPTIHQHALINRNNQSLKN